MIRVTQPTKVVIKYAHNYAIAIAINQEIYYIRTGPDIPMIYNADLKKLYIPNADSWIQAQTQQRHSYRGILDMAEAFKMGTQFSYDNSTIKDLLKKYYIMVRNIIFNSKHNKEYIENYKIEAMSNKQLETMLQDVETKYQQYVTKFGMPKLQAYLNRIYACCKNREINTQTIEVLIKRTGVQPTCDIVQMNDGDILDEIIEKCVNLGLTTSVKIDQRIIENTIFVEGTRL